jgi:hypothetical protein
MPLGDSSLQHRKGKAGVRATDAQHNLAPSCAARCRYSISDAALQGNRRARQCSITCSVYHGLLRTLFAFLLSALLRAQQTCRLHRPFKVNIARSDSFAPPAPK